MITPPHPNPEAFWARLVPVGDCLEWQGALRSDGYGNVGFGGVTYITHRVAWATIYGPISTEEFVLHRCDNRLCCNPAHFFLGTQADNMADKIAKGRHWRGRDACGRGHAFTPENTTRRISPSGKKVRRCKTCDRVDALARYHRLKIPKA